MKFPKEDKQELCLIQQFLVFQIYLPITSAWNLEIIIADTSRTKRRINFINRQNKIENNFFHVKVPNYIIKHGIWLNLSIDTNSFMEVWKGFIYQIKKQIIKKRLNFQIYRQYNYWFLMQIKKNIYNEKSFIYIWKRRLRNINILILLIK
ncbi:hypothetical protein IMG5_181220 [Ichthyophthirius multifiliis]|uniref:CFA20 domain-containing protein n=1 Tax=Ichthyophthirius multifiliis TaxID=5932 RepID=G0R2Y2_ICHMU|nr:hypothetical protein IMG5_181220 [Ichthyophthirius multifiliis]EGR28193.1 hypothetical protein IMG5_181220 [Ichthyophthirius multifiliis]|eukprot:XP_004027538.1 hypothetical protein IMG5_181220 [Ichthyophthirius multifiliis]